MAKILIADDASFMRSSLKFIMENNGHDVIATAESGPEACELYKKHKPDLVTMDIMMKGGDGLTALREITAADPGAKVVMVTALGQDDKQAEARENGAAGYIRKPFKADQVMEELAKVLGL